MLTYLKDRDGKIEAFCEWKLVGQSGYEMENGKYLWVNDLWIHESVRNEGRLGMLIEEIFAVVPDETQICYFKRSRHSPAIHTYTREQMARMCEKSKEKVR